MSLKSYAESHNFVHLLAKLEQLKTVFQSVFHQKFQERASKKAGAGVFTVFSFPPDLLSSIVCTPSNSCSFEEDPGRVLIDCAPDLNRIWKVKVFSQDFLNQKVGCGVLVQVPFAIGVGWV